MWPFKKRPVISSHEYTAMQPPAPCGNQNEHYFWIDLNGMPCPICRANETRERKLSEQDTLAELIASKVVEKLQAAHSREELTR